MKAILLLSVLWFTVCLNSQNSSYINYGVINGLPSSEVYSVLEDSKGFMWFGTDRGVVRFDGQEFDLFTTDKGLLDNVIFHIYEDHLGRIWFISYSGQLCYFYNNKIHKFKYAKVLDKISKVRDIRTFYVDADLTVHFGLYHLGFVTIDTLGRTDIIDLSKTRNSVQVVNGGIGYSITVDYISDSLKYLTYLKNGSSSKILIPEINKIKKTVPINRETIFAIAIDSSNNDIYFSIWNLLYRIRDNNIVLIQKFESRIISIMLNKENMFIGLYASGYRMYSKDDMPMLVHDGLKQYSVSDFHVDKNGNKWFTTLESGIFRSETSEFLMLDKNKLLLSDNILAVEGSSEEVLFGDDKGGLSVLSLETGLIENISAMYNDDGVRNIFYDTLSRKFYVFRYGLSEYSKGQEKQISGAPMFSFVFSGSDSLFVLTENMADSLRGKMDANVIQSLTNFKGGKQIDKNGFKFATVIKSLDTVYIGGVGGLYKVVNKEVTSVGAEHDLFSYRIVEFCNIDKNDFCWATRDAGLVFYNSGNPYSISKADGLVSNQLTSVCKDENGDIWVGSSEGISIVKNGENTILNLTIEQGLSSNEINDIFLYGSRAYVASKAGVNVIEKSSIKIKKNVVPIYLKSISLVDSVITLQEKNYNLIVNYDEPFVEVRFIGVSYTNPKNIEYRYKLRENDFWKYTKNDKILFSELRSGLYQVSIEASINGEFWSTVPAKLSINVLQPFWETNWFVFLAVICVVGTTLFSFYIVFGRIKRKELNRRKIQGLRMEVLNAQMNPHFIFNSLNSIQSFILKNDKKSSNRYLSKFAKLMRLTLDQTSETNVVLEKELELMHLYLELENIRFEKSIDYKISISDNIDVNRMLIPSLLIQPIVENAIWHGLSPSLKKKELSISFNLKLYDVVIEIFDNGVGREVSRAHSDHEHKSKGNQLVIDRVKLFAKEYFLESHFEIVDLKSSEDEIGTLVRITIPYILK